MNLSAGEIAELLNRDEILVLFKLSYDYAEDPERADAEVRGLGLVRDGVHEPRVLTALGTRVRRLVYDRWRQHLRDIGKDTLPPDGDGLPPESLDTPGTPRDPTDLWYAVHAFGSEDSEPNFEVHCDVPDFDPPFSQWSAIAGRPYRLDPTFDLRMLQEYKKRLK